MVSTALVIKMSPLDARVRSPSETVMLLPLMLMSEVWPLILFESPRVLIARESVKFRLEAMFLVVSDEDSENLLLPSNPLVSLTRSDELLDEEVFSTSTAEMILTLPWFETKLPVTPEMFDPEIVKS